MSANPWTVSDECRAAVAALIARRTHAPPDETGSRALSDAILEVVQADFARAARAAFERARRPSNN
jgi:hypothetical protein